ERTAPLETSSQPRIPGRSRVYHRPLFRAVRSGSRNLQSLQPGNRRQRCTGWREKNRGGTLARSALSVELQQTRVPSRDRQAAAFGAESIERKSGGLLSST